ncbi:hypothetical protein [Leminorella grimontii]|uniref:hypothetical protein n=1 Tax=Leminorella grimontii TaxID=82981 RepID=UPI0032200FA5
MSVTDNVRKMDGGEVLKRYRNGEDFICHFCRIPLAAIPEDPERRESVMQLYCPNNANHFSVYREGENMSVMRESTGKLLQKSDG